MINPGLLSWPELATRMSIMPAHIARLSGQGQPLAVGEPAVTPRPRCRATIPGTAANCPIRWSPLSGQVASPTRSLDHAGRITYQKAQ
jgi:dihydroorotase